MATGRIGVTPTLRTRWSKQPTAGTTSLSGLDDNSVALVYDVGYEAVYRNGTLLSRGNDYTATTGTTVTLIDATLAGDIIEILANQLVPLSDAISKGQFTAKGALLSATAASTPGVLAVGTNGQVLTAASGQSTGLQWTTLSSGSYTQLATGSFSGASTTISSIDQTYQDLLVVIKDISNTVGYGVGVRLNNDSTAGVGYSYLSSQSSTDVTSGTTSSSFMNGADTTSAGLYGQLLIRNYTATGTKSIQWNCARSATVYTTGGATSAVTAAVTSLVFLRENGNATMSFNGGTYILYGVK